ncbi:lysozyme inhibitor LprI family protein [Novosphingobium sp. LASN5T]|uniref:lysozyme inhibitor LprI family protein n=1 Tax=Novosphingobium sp. LASN5T TaxID=2491021 RepID=UPI000F5EA088|nr:lysozyme inhibitor LprI family protein [Novosphingobium sp. LASN5T]RQW38953.1 DUF1311 domain-containing protein [Novosphingobium sp. LASN5T]
MKCLHLLSPVAIILATSAAHAASKTPFERRYSETYNRCMDTGDAAQGITSGMIACTEAERHFQDGKLNQAYKMVISRLPASRQDDLRRSERNWIKARDSICAKELTGEFVGGSMSHVTWLGCLMDETIKRTMALEQYR